MTRNVRQKLSKHQSDRFVSCMQKQGLTIFDNTDTTFIREMSAESLIALGLNVSLVEAIARLDTTWLSPVLNSLARMGQQPSFVME